MSQQLPETGPLFEALADPDRRQVIELLCRGPLRAGELARATQTDPARMSRHLRVLLDAGLVRDERGAEDARVRMFHLRHEGLDPLGAWLSGLQRQWDAQLQAFKAHIETRQTNNEGKTS